MIHRRALANDRARACCAAKQQQQQLRPSCTVPAPSRQQRHRSTRPSRATAAQVLAFLGHAPLLDHALFSSPPVEYASKTFNQLFNKPKPGQRQPEEEEDRMQQPTTSTSSPSASPSPSASVFQQQEEMLASTSSMDGENAGIPSLVAVAEKATAISWAGSGLYFFWQLGAMKYLAEHMDLSKVPMSGASGGGLVAVLAACGVPADLVFKRAYELSLQYNIWERPLGLTGVWGSLVEEWLNELLPDNAHELCRGRVTLIVTTMALPGGFQQVGISDFRDKKDLVEACMASAHVPIVLDLKMSRQCRGKHCVDGSFPDFFFGNCEMLTKSGRAVVFDYFYDKDLKRNGRMDMLTLTSLDDIVERMEVGYRYAQRLHEQHGAFDTIVSMSSYDEGDEQGGKKVMLKGGEEVLVFA